MKQKTQRHQTCPFCFREILTHIINTSQLFDYCPNCGTQKKEQDHIMRMDTDEQEENELLYLYLIGEA